ncbi:MAG: hypothetical protein EON54_12410 [Alcaligenaceae bacterium]|nr:MAG: hypothetical protein EON54_12410 [Alcaligenaceae bacterium]
MEHLDSERALYSHPGIKGWTLHLSREPPKPDDPLDNPITYVGSIHFGEVLHCRLVLSTLEGPSEARAELNRRFEEWVYEYAARKHLSDTERGQP